MAEPLQFRSWSASRLDDYTLCPFMAKQKHLLKLCPSCFKGRLKGYPDQLCDTCHKPRPVPLAFARGGEIGEALERYVNGKARTLTKMVENPQAREIAADLRKKFKLGSVRTEMSINFDRNFKVLPPEWSPQIWLIVKLDVWVADGEMGYVLDWKTGGVDRSGNIRVQDKYDDQLLAYKVAGLSAFPSIKRINSSLCFVDAAANISPTVEREPLDRKDLKKAQDRLRKLSLPVMSDKVFAPRPNDRCRWCDYAKGKGGPCKF